MRYDVIVVGCGAAGVAALSHLSRAGQRALGLEAQGRIGGRVRTVRMGGAVELGAEWIHGESGNSVYSLARRHSLPITIDTIAFDVRRSDGTAPDRDLCDELMAFCMSCRDEEPSHRPLGEYITEKFYAYISERGMALDADFCAQFLSLAGLVCDNYDATDNWNDTSVRGSQQYHELPGHLHWSFGRRGYETIFKLILGDPKPEIRVNCEVSKVQCDADSVTVRCANGEEYVTSSVIVTVSLGVLKERHKSLFEPPLPASKVFAIETLSMGVMDKVCLQYSSVWWPQTRKFFGFLWRGEELASVEEWMRRIMGFSVATGAENVITLWTSGENAKLVEVLPEEQVLRGCKRLLQMFMGATVAVPDPIAIVRSTWHANPHTRGSYSFRGRATDDHPNLWSDLAEPICDASGTPRIVFAGEACSQHYYSTVHGALDTGTAAATLLLHRASSAKLRSKI